MEAEANAGQFSIYIIALAKSDDQLDIFHCALLQQKFYDKEDLFIVGLAASYTEAVDMVVAMTEKVVRETGGADIKNIFWSTDKQELKPWES